MEVRMELKKEDMEEKCNIARILLHSARNVHY